MLLTEQRPELKEMLHESLTRAANEVAQGHGGVYAFVLYPSSGFVDIGVAFSIRNSLVRLAEKGAEVHVENEDPYLGSNVYYEVNASEWEFFYTDFPEVNGLLADNYDDFYEAGIEPEEISRFFEDLLIEIMSQLKADGTLSPGPFEEDLLFGIQFPDASGAEIDIMERASQALNSPSWHHKIRTHCAALKRILGE